MEGRKEVKEMRNFLISSYSGLRPGVVGWIFFTHSLWAKRVVIVKGVSPG